MTDSTLSESASDPTLRALLLVGAALVLAAAFPFVVGGDQYLLGVACLTLIFAIATTGWNYISGFAGSMSVGHAAFFGIGAYIAVIAQASCGINAWIALALSGMGAALLSLGLGLLSFRVTGPYFALITVACAEILRLAVGSVDQIGQVKIGGARGLILMPAEPSLIGFQFTSKEPYYFVLLAVLVAVLAITSLVDRSKVGLYWAALRTDPHAAASLGVPVLRYRCYASLCSGFVAGLAGGLYACYVGFIDPGRALGIDLSVEFLIFGMIGGRATVLGPAVGALVLFPLGELIRANTGSSSGLHIVIYGLLLIFSVYYFPKGLAGFFSTPRRNLEGRQ